MAGTTDPEKAGLIAELAAARQRLGETGEDFRLATERLKARVDLPARARRSYEAHRGVWLAGATLAGFLLSRLPARKKVVYVERVSGQAVGLAGKVGMLWPAVKFLGGFAGPLVSKVVGARVAEWVQRFVPGSAPEDEFGGR